MDVPVVVGGLVVEEDGSMVAHFLLPGGLAFGGMAGGDGSDP